MLKPFRRLFGGSNNSVAPPKGSALNESLQLSGSAERDWIEPELMIPRPDLDLADLPEMAGVFVRQIVRDALNDELELPIMPELGLAVRRKTLDPSASASDLALLIQTNIDITTKLIQVANSPLYAGYEPIQSLNEAVARIGMTAVRDIVTGLTIKQILVNEQPRLRRRMRELWEHSARVAANCSVLARQQLGVDPDQALLAGLVHDIGELAIIKYANAFSTDELSDEALTEAIQHLSGKLGALTLRQWNLDEEFVFAALHADNFERVSEPVVRLVDLVQVAQLHLLSGIPGEEALDLRRAPTVKHLRLTTEEPGKGITVLTAARHDIEQVRAALAI
jgi:HD-like signal output (HDOD) protein